MLSCGRPVGWGDGKPLESPELQLGKPHQAQQVLRCRSTGGPSAAQVEGGEEASCAEKKLE